MISKILITLAVIMACMWVLSTRNKPELRQVVNPEAERRKKLLRHTAMAFMLIMVAAAGTMIYLEVDEQSAVVTVHVVNTQSGTRKTYQAMKNEINSDGFTTLDGLQVFIASVERIEIESQ